MSEQAQVPDLSPLRGMTLSQAVRLTPATLAYHITDGRWIPARHLLYMAQEIAREITLGDARLIIEAPPRHGKSELFSVHTPTWFLDRWPSKFVMLTSYNADLPVGFSRRVRDTIASYGGVLRGPSTMARDEADDLPAFARPVLNVRLRSDAKRVDQWHTSENGGMFAIGIGGSLTGRGADLLLVDDFVKNAEEAESPTTQEHIWEWFTSTAYTRLEPGTSLVVLATRWNRRDLIGRLLDKRKELGGRWRLIELPAEAFEDDPLGRKQGEPLWPERYPIESLRERHAVLGNYFYQALYQQRPINREDVQVTEDDLIIADILPSLHLTTAVRSWDLAASEKKGDFTVGTLYGVQGNPGTSHAKYHMYDQIRGQWKSEKVEETMLKTAQDDGYGVTIVIEREPGAAGKAYAAYLADKILKDYKTIVVPATEDKWIKSQPLLAAIANHQVILRRAPWNKPFKEELKDFPNANHDDTIDSAAIGFNYIMTLKQVSPTWGRSSQDKPYVARDASASSFVKGAVFGRR